MVQNLYHTQAWSKLRTRVRAEEPTCYACDRPSTSVDHIVPALEEPALFFVRSNVRGSCKWHNMGRAGQRARKMARINTRTPPEREW